MTEGEEKLMHLDNNTDYNNNVPCKTLANRSLFPKAPLKANL